MQRKLNCGRPQRGSRLDGEAPQKVVVLASEDGLVSGLRLARQKPPLI